MIREFKKDPGLKQVYIANLAWLIYDNQKVSTSPPKENLKKMEGCNRMAERILKLIFE
jgi:hypothetical protein